MCYSKTILSAGCELNDHLNELAKSNMKSSKGWIVDCDEGSWQENPNEKKAAECTKFGVYFNSHFPFYLTQNT